jgi:hypothetical protein
MRELEETPSRKPKAEKILNDKKRKLEITPTPTRAVSKRRCIVKHSPGLTQSPASSMSSDFPSLEELFSSSLGRQSSPATQPSPSKTRLSLVHSPASSPPVSKSKGLRDISNNTGATPKPQVPRFGESPSLFVSPDQVSGPANEPFTFKRSASRSARKVARTQHETILPSRFRETTADFEAMDTSEKLLLLFKMSRGKEM